MTIASLRTSPGGRVQHDALNLVRDIIPAANRLPSRQIGVKPANLASLSAERQRRHRERLAAGRIVLPIEINDRMVEAMLLSGMVSEAESRCRADLTKAIEEALADWAERAFQSLRHA